MKRKKIILLICFVIGFFSLLHYVYNNFYSKSMLLGNYINVNYENRFGGDFPHSQDTLTLLKNGTFTSQYYGKGTYKVSYSLGGTSIDLEYKDEFGVGGLITSIEGDGFGKPRIILIRDLNQYYEKIQ